MQIGSNGRHRGGFDCQAGAMALRHGLAELEEMTHHVAYEHRGLWWFLTVDVPIGSGDERGRLLATLMQQARLEAGLIHLRVLTDFLLSGRDDRYPLVI